MKNKLVKLLFLTTLISLSSCKFPDINNVNRSNIESSKQENEKAYERIDDKIYFGEYPQKEVTDLLLINELNTLAGTKPTSSNKYNWTDYNYYIEGEVTSYMFYIDIDYDKDGDHDYRGVYFIQYRPKYCVDSSSSSNSEQYENGYYTNTIYWFSFDKIEWNILKEENGKALIIANLLLDSQDYYSVYDGVYYDKHEHNGGIGYSNNYELSNIRKFLNDNFYNTAFNTLEKELIEVTEVDNSVSSTCRLSNKYVCNNTFDKMFLLSYQEAKTYYSSGEERIAQGSDYAESQGLYDGFGFFAYWLRSPCSYDSSHANFVGSKGGVDYYNNVYYTNYGVRAACNINL